MKWHSESFTDQTIEKMKRLYVSDEICDVDLARRFNIGVHRLYALMKKAGVYRCKAKAEGRIVHKDADRL